MVKQSKIINPLESITSEDIDTYLNNEKAQKQLYNRTAYLRRINGFMQLDTENNNNGIDAKAKAKIRRDEVITRLRKLKEFNGKGAHLKDIAKLTTLNPDIITDKRKFKKMINNLQGKKATDSDTDDEENNNQIITLIPTKKAMKQQQQQYKKEHKQQKKAFIQGEGFFSSENDEPATIDKIINAVKKAEKLYKVGKAGYTLYNDFYGGAKAQATQDTEQQAQALTPRQIIDRQRQEQEQPNNNTDTSEATNKNGIISLNSADMLNNVYNKAKGRKNKLNPLETIYKAVIDDAYKQETHYNRYAQND